MKLTSLESVSEHLLVAFGSAIPSFIFKLQLTLGDATARALAARESMESVEYIEYMEYMESVNSNYEQRLISPSIPSFPFSHLTASIAFGCASHTRSCCDTSPAISGR